MSDILLFVVIGLLGLLTVMLWMRTRSVPQESFAPYTEQLERSIREQMSQSRSEAADNFSRFSRELKDDLDRVEKRSKEDFVAFDNTLKERFNQMAKYSTEQNDKLVLAIKETTFTVEQKLTNIREDNEKQLEKMRATVDEKLQTTLDKRLSESFQRVSEQLESVFKGLGEMQTLASDVGDLKKVLSNVKIRGTWGEYQLGNILEQMLAPSQYAKNVATVKGSQANVEYAVKLPGKDSSDMESFVYLPIDSKFPIEDYHTLIAASEVGNIVEMETARKNLLKRVKSFAKDIHDKYVDPPHTTDFAIMFLPIEGIYAEILREPGVFEDIQRLYKVTITGPTTLAAFLSSLQMGFRTLAIEKKSAMVWQTLSAVKTEFGNFSKTLDLAHKQLMTAQGTLENLKSTRLRAMNRKLTGLESMDSDTATSLLELNTEDQFDDQENE